MLFTTELNKGEKYKIVKNGHTGQLGGVLTYVYIGDGKVVILDGPQAGTTVKPHKHTVWQTTL